MSPFPVRGYNSLAANSLERLIDIRDEARQLIGTQQHMPEKRETHKQGAGECYRLPLDEVAAVSANFDARRAWFGEGGSSLLDLLGIPAVFAACTCSVGPLGQAAPDDHEEGVC